jgi:hypothetical protein
VKGGANESPEATSSERARLTDARNGLLRLHKTLLDWERIRYERSNGRISDNMKLLHLTINDPAFAWLRELSALIVQIDERMEDTKAPLTSSDVKSLRTEIRELLAPSQTGGDFQRNYYWALQETPDIVVAHSSMLKLLPG